MDADGDGFWGIASAWAGCDMPSGYIADGSDCDDGNAWAHDNAAMEVCDGYDNNCDGSVDEDVTLDYYPDQVKEARPLCSAMGSCISSACECQ
jgi:hypothetical protein